jgi:hypothetical protein
MLLICESCGNANTSLMKVPCGFYIDYVDNLKKLTFTMPLNNEEVYRNICLECILGPKEQTT